MIDRASCLNTAAAITFTRQGTVRSEGKREMAEPTPILVYSPSFPISVF